MPATTARIKTVSGSSMAVGWAGAHTLTIDRPASADGNGLGFSGGELLLLAIGACYYNDLFRAAAQRGIVVHSVHVAVTCTWDGDPVRAQDVAIAAVVAAEASEADILALVHRVDQIAEVPNSLRLGTAVTLADARAVPVSDHSTENVVHAARAH